MFHLAFYSSFFFFNDTATTEIYTLSLHDALPIFAVYVFVFRGLPILIVVFLFYYLPPMWGFNLDVYLSAAMAHIGRSEEHTSELQSHLNLVCRLLLEKKKTIQNTPTSRTSAQSPA